MGKTFFLEEEQFVGPLDILLQLTEKDKLDISKISLARVTDQYVHYVNGLEQRLHFNELMFFVDIASKLIMLKSRLLLPYLEGEDDDEGDELIEQLKSYKQALDKAKELSKLFSDEEHLLIGNESRSRTHGRNAQQFLDGITPRTLNETIRAFLEKNTRQTVSLKTVRRVCTIEEKIAHIKERLQKLSSFQFHSILGKGNSRSEIIVNFLALLELAKLATIRLEQEAHFEPIHVHSMN